MKVLFSSIIIIVSLLLFSCNKDKETPDETSSSIQGEIPPTEVNTVLVEDRPFEYLVQVTGIIQAKEEAHVLLKSTGIIKKLYVQNGDYISGGELIAEIESDKQELDLEKADATLAEKKVEFEDRKLSFISGKDTLVGRKILLNIRFTSGLAAAELNYKQALLDFEKTKLRSPISGIVSALSIKKHNPAPEGKLASIIYNPNTLLVNCSVAEIDALQIKRHYKASVKSTVSDKKFTALVIDIDPRVNEESRLVNVALQLKNVTEFIPGMSVQVTIQIPSQNSVLIPKEGVVIKSGKPVAFTEEAGKAKWNYITTGRENGKEIEVLSGLEKGKKVIVSNNLQLSHDAPVKVTN